MLFDWKVGGGRGGLLLPSYAYVTSDSKTTDATSFTFAGTSIGTAGPNRLVVVASAMRSTSSNSYSSVTIGGSAAAAAVEQNAVQTNVGLHALLVPSGTTADIVVTMTGTAARCVIGVYALYNLASTTAAATAYDATYTLALSLNTQPQGIVLATAYCGGSTSEVLTGVTQDYKLSPEGANCIGASVLCTAAETPRTVTCAITGGAGPGGVSAFWR